MGSLSFSEIVVIVLVILVVFGPKRLPELARKAGELMGKVRSASSALTGSLSEEYEATIEPIRSVRQDFDGLKADLTKTVTSIGTPTESSDKPGTGDVVARPDDDADEDPDTS